MENKNNTGQNNFLNHLNIGQRAADRITSIVGSWKFLLIQSILLMFWLILNVIVWKEHWDPYPFILLNLILSFQAAYTAPIILMSQNRTTEKDRQKAEIDLATDRKAEREIRAIQEKLEVLEKEKINKILAILEDEK